MAVLLFGMAGLFGKWIDQSPLVITYGRATIAAAALLILMVCRKERIAPLNHRHTFLLMLQGFLLAAHWMFVFLFDPGFNGCDLA